MKVARDLGERIRPGEIVTLSGELGAGKTCFVRGFVQAFGIPPGEVVSPTFNLVQEYDGRGGLPLYHMDCYRIEDPREALEFGIEEYFYGDGVSIIEWPEKIESLLPDRIVRVELTVLDEKGRQISITRHSGSGDGPDGPGTP